MYKILVFEPDVTAYTSTHVALRSHKPAIEGTYHFVERLTDIQKYLTPGEPQMVIIGTTVGPKISPNEYLPKFRSINAELVCISYCMYEVSGPFDLKLQRPWITNTEKLISAIDQFLDGKLKSTHHETTEWARCRKME